MLSGPPAAAAPGLPPESPTAAPRPAGAAARWAAWIGLGLGLDFAVWFGLQHIAFLAANPGSAAALALCWVHVFVLPPCFARPWCWRWLLGGPVLGGAGAPLGLGIGFAIGLQAGSLAFLSLVAFSTPATESTPYHPPQPVLDALLQALFYILIGGSIAAGGAIAGFLATGIAALVPGLPRPRLSWRVALAGAIGATVFLPMLLPLWGPAVVQEPACLLTAALLSLILVNWRAITTS